MKLLPAEAKKLGQNGVIAYRIVTKIHNHINMPNTETIYQWIFLGLALFPMPLAIFLKKKYSKISILLRVSSYISALAWGIIVAVILRNGIIFNTLNYFITPTSFSQRNYAFYTTAIFVLGWIFLLWIIYKFIQYNDKKINS